MSEPPLVSVGFALRNSESRYGRAVLERAIATMRDQSYKHLEILVGDNGSSDGTTAICEAWAKVDARVRIVRHDPPLSAQGNFIHLFRATSGKYFTWMADDDFRTLNHLAVLVEALERHPEAALAFSDQREFSDHATYTDGWEVRRPFVTAGLSRRERLNQMPRGSCTHLCYGLLRREALNQYDWLELDNSSFDVPMGYYLSLRAEMVYEPGACYYRFVPANPKDPAARAAVNNYGAPRWFFPERMCWACCRAAAQATRLTGGLVPAWRFFPRIYLLHHQDWRGILVRIAPAFIHRAWRRWRHGAGPGPA